MSGTDLAGLDREALIALVLTLQAEVEALKRGGKRQAAPFSKGTRVKDPKRPGRKPGRGVFQRREASEQVGEPPIDVPVGETAGPKCGGEFDEARVEEASIPDLPQVVRPRARLFRVGVRRCRRCGATARGRPPDRAADPRGATAHRLGPRLLAAAHHLHDGLGGPVRKGPAVIAILTGVRLTQGAVTRDALKKAAGAIGTTYRTLGDSVREAPFVHTDDTGWRGGLAGLADGLRDRHRDGLPGPAAAPQRGGRRAGAGRLRRGDEHRPRDQLGRGRTGRCAEAEVPGPRPAVAVGGAGDEVPRGVAVREAAEGPAQAGAGAVA